MIVIVSCGAAKQPGQHQARHLYTGGYFKNTYAWATSIVPATKVYILSAKYGLVNALDEINYYDLTLGQPGAIQPATVKQQATDRNLLNEDVIVVGGVRYVDLARTVWPNAIAPFGKGGGLLPNAGIGRQMKALKQWHGKIPGRT